MPSKPVKSGALSILTRNTGLYGYAGAISYETQRRAWLDFMSDYKMKGVNPLNLPFVDNGTNMVTKENADEFYLG